MSENNSSTPPIAKISIPIFGDAGEPEPDFYSRLVKSIPGIVYRFRLTPNGEMGFDYISRDLDSMWYPEEIVTLELQNRKLTNSVVIHPEEGPELVEAIMKSAREMSPYTWTGRVLTHKQEVRWLQASSLPVAQSDGSIIWDGVMLDATREKIQELELDKMRTEFAIHARLASIGEVASTLAHEVNTPLSSLLLVTDIIEREASQPIPNLERIIEKNRLSQKITQKISQIIHSLLQVSRSEKPLPKTPISIPKVLSSSLILSSEQNSIRNITVHRDYLDRGNAQVQAAQTDLMTIASNLLQNATEAVRNGTRKEIWVDYEVSLEGVKIQVSDSGTGIAEKHLEKIFKSFFTTKASGQGSGLGLLLCHRIAERNQWKLEYSRTPENLTRFTLTMPALSASP